MNNPFISFLIVFSSFIKSSKVQGGHCWKNIDAKHHCKGLVLNVQSREECCSPSHSAKFGYTEIEVDAGTIFKWQALEKGAPNCYPCHENCANMNCGEQKVCVMKNKTPKCICNTHCTRTDKSKGEVCGNTLKTYRSICHLNRVKCQKNSNLHFQYYGKCSDSCEDVVCPKDKHCVLDQNHMAHCITCPTDCKNYGRKEVCASNGITYENSCFAREDNCFSNTTKLYILYDGKCQDVKSCENFTCDNGKKCLKDERHASVQCVRCSDFACPQINASICGSDNQTYSSWCHLKKESCRRAKVIYVLHQNPCTHL